MLNEIFGRCLTDRHSKTAKTFAPADASGSGDVIDSQIFLIMCEDEIDHTGDAAGMGIARQLLASQSLLRRGKCEKLLPNPAEQSNALQFVACVAGAKRLECGEQLQNGRVAGVAARKERKSGRRVQQWGNRVLVQFSKKRACKIAGNTPKVKISLPGAV